MLRDLLRAAADSEVIDAPAYVDGEWIRSGTSFERVGPYLREVVTRAWTPGEQAVVRALEAAARGATVVARWSPARRAGVLDRAAELAARHRDALALVIARELGKPVSDGGKEIDRLADTFRICAHEARRIGGDVLPVAGWDNGVGNTALTYRAPLGVALVITPFNAPANLLAHKLGASFAAGNTTIVKSPPQAPGVSAAVVALLLEAGMPGEAVQLLHGGGELGARLCGADEVAVISFTGSAATGEAVARAAGAKRLVLELGGNAATIVCDDADVEAAARVCARTGYSNSGQSCISVQRIYAHRSVLEEFVAVLTKEVARLRVGDPVEAGTDVGSMVDAAAASRVQAWIEEAVAEGADLACGGDRDGATLQPSVVVNPRPDATLVRQEAFGAVVAVLPFDDFDEVLAECNRSRFGLQAGIFTQRLDRTLQAWRELQVGAVVVNGSSNYRLDHVPFGGVKDSGFGRETPSSMIEDYTQVKTLIVRNLSIWGNE
ncbi:aldehyde dehydrogenase family protein [Kineosporia succinea]|uniref:Acyl-CoA reductase-like NAD-dependent aldehyde dehydrogenase n=1 Tax=Kineosporia succinea TaxID=84632 RepID=A0ABT9PAJ2_9ACTN|nr:aldehyde dehydrogenase family protein [Kineosporia succinea]MDP9829717.1 acyl-CoA reductase-like NAD-dependent aldehyde dehydrogenase [Kineosporia succinea]